MQLPPALPETKKSRRPALGVISLWFACGAIGLGVLNVVVIAAMGAVLNALDNTEDLARTVGATVALGFAVLIIGASLLAILLGLLALLGVGKANGTSRPRMGLAGMLMGCVPPVGYALTFLALASFSRARMAQIEPSPDPDWGQGVVEEMPEYAMAESDVVEASPENPQVVSGDLFEDYDYAFRIRRPSDQWRFMDQAKVHSFNADAMMGVINPRLRGFTVLIVEPMEGATLEQYASLVIDSSPLGLGTQLEKKLVEIDGYPALVIEQQAVVEGLDFTYHFQIVNRENTFYNIMGWAPSQNFPGVKSELVAIAESIEFIKDRAPITRDSFVSQDDYGATWQLVDSVYSNASFGFRLKLGDGFRVMGRVELANLDPDAEAGLVCAAQSFFQVLSMEQIGEADYEPLNERYLAGAEAALQLNEQGPRLSQVEIAGLEAEQRLYDEVFNNGTFDAAFTTFQRGTVCYRLKSWWPTAQREASHERLAESYQHFQWLGQDEQDQIAIELAHRDMNNAVGPGYSLRGGTFRDFENGFTLKTPPGSWIAKTGDVLRQENSDARLILHLPEDGVYLTVIPETLDMDHEAYHNLLRQNIGADPPGAEGQGPDRRETKGDLELFITSYNAPEGEAAAAYRLVTAARGQLRVQFLLWGLQSNQKAIDEQLPLVIKGIDLPKDPTSSVERRGSTIVDHRLGYELTAPEGWKIKNVPMAQFKALASGIVTDQQESAIVVMAFCSPMGFDEDLAIDGMITNTRFVSSPGSRRERETSLAGLQARELEMSGEMVGKPAFLKIWMAKRGHTMYMLLATGAKGSRHEAEVDQYKQQLKLIK